MLKEMLFRQLFFTNLSHIVLKKEMKIIADDFFRFYSIQENLNLSINIDDKSVISIQVLS